MLIVVIAAVGRVVEQRGVITVLLAAVEPFKLVNALHRNGIAVRIQQTHGSMIQTGHIPFKAGVHQLVRILSRDLHFLHITDLKLHRLIERGVICTGAAVRIVFRLAQVIGQHKKIKTGTGGDIIGFCGTVLIARQYGRIAESGSQNILQGHEALGRVLGLTRVRVVLAAHPLACGCALLAPLHACEALLKVQLQFALIARVAGQKVDIEEGFLIRRKRGSIGRVGRVIDLVVVFIKLQIAEPAVAAVIAELIVSQHGENRLSIGIRQRFYAGAVMVATDQHEYLIVILGDIPNLPAVAAKLNGIRGGSRAGLHIVRGDDRGAVWIFIQHLAQPSLIVRVPLCASADGGNRYDQIVIAARLHKHIGAVFVSVRREVQIPVGAARPCAALSAEAVVGVHNTAAPAVVVAKLRQQLDPGLGNAVKGVAGIFVLLVGDIIHNIAQMNDCFYIKIVRRIDQLVDCGVHDIRTILHRVLRIGQEHKVIVIRVLQLIRLVAAEVAGVFRRIGNQPVVLLQCRIGDAYLLQAAL